jgi:hypothetical protein
MLAQPKDHAKNNRFGEALLFVASTINISEVRRLRGERIKFSIL